MEDRYEIIDDNGVIHSGNEEEMRLAWQIMTGDDLSDELSPHGIESLKVKYDSMWVGDLKLIQIHAIHR